MEAKKLDSIIASMLSSEILSIILLLAALITTRQSQVASSHDRIDKLASITAK